MPRVARQAPRCRFVDDDGFRCRRVATVRGGFCRQCAVALELELEAGGPEDTLIGTLDRAFSRGAADPMIAQLGAFFGGILGAAVLRRAPASIQDPLRDIGERAAREARARAAAAGDHASARDAAGGAPPRSQAREPDPTLEKRQAIRDARTVMGFDFEQPLTVDAIKDRKRALARVFHPDAGGDQKHMQRVNAAADLLAKNLARP